MDTRGWMLSAASLLSYGLAPSALDPLTLLNSKGAQATSLRPYRAPVDNSGLSTATLALG